MIKDFLSLNKPRQKGVKAAPVKETGSKTVSAQRFNEMIEYYTAELRSRLKEIERLKQENEMLIKTSIKNASRSDEFRRQNVKLTEEIRRLKE